MQKRALCATPVAAWLELGFIESGEVELGWLESTDLSPIFYGLWLWLFVFWLIIDNN